MVCSIRFLNISPENKLWFGLDGQQRPSILFCWIGKTGRPTKIEALEWVIPITSEAEGVMSGTCDTTKKKTLSAELVCCGTLGVTCVAAQGERRATLGAVGDKLMF